jgi:hypothetical protein
MKMEFKRKKGQNGQTEAGIIIFFGIIGVLIVWMTKLFSGEIFSEIAKTFTKQGISMGLLEGVLVVVGIPLFLAALLKIFVDAWKGRL